MHQYGCKPERFCSTVRRAVRLEEFVEMREDNTPSADAGLASLAGGGAAVGAGFGGLIGAVVGWILGAQVTAVPQIGPVVGQWVLPSALVGLLAGVAIGALVGALAAIAGAGPRPARAASQAVADAQNESYDSLAQTEQMAEPPAVEMAVAEAPVVPLATRTLTTKGLVQDEAPAAKTGPRHRPKVRTVKIAEETAPAQAALVEAENNGPLDASVSSVEAPVQDAAHKETEATMDTTDRGDEQVGRDPNTFTGTKDAVDSETGTMGTAGTPVTTGYGVSGSTIGTGSPGGQDREGGEFRGATPDTHSYDLGGRDTGDSDVLQGSEREPSVVDKNSEAGRVEASVPREAEGRDVYEQSEGYVENLERDSVPPAASSGAPESQGTNVPGTEDPRGLGDNTDEPR
jgi:hypothetical protein